MTQIWPGFGVAPVPTVESVICKPEGVVMVFPAVWANTLGGIAMRRTPATATAIGRFRNMSCRIFSNSFVTGTESLTHRRFVQYPSAQPSLPGYDPPVSV